MKDPKAGVEGTPMITNRAGPTTGIDLLQRGHPRYEHGPRTRRWLPVVVESSLFAQTRVRKGG